MVLAVFVYAFLNGLNDSSGLVAAAISSRSLSPLAALWIASIAEFVGPFAFGTAVAETIGTNLVKASSISMSVIFVAVSSAVIWNITSLHFGLPSSSTHALLGGLIGAVTVAHGPESLLPVGFAKVLISLLIGPVLGLVSGYLLMRVTKFLTQFSTPRVNVFFKRAQLANVIALALSHGANDGQKSMGLIALAIATLSPSPLFHVPVWATFLCAIALSLGVRIGGWRIIRTLGTGIYRLRPAHAFSAQTASAALVLGAALLGGPVSTTQVVSTAIIGVGSAERISAVRWGVARQIVVAWLVTIPAAAIIAALFESAWMHWA